MTETNRPMSFVSDPQHPSIATSLDLIGALQSLDVHHHDDTIRLLARAVKPYDRMTDEMFTDAMIEDGRWSKHRFEETGWFESITKAPFNGGTVSVEHTGFTDYTFEGPSFEVRVIERDHGDPHITVPTFPVMHPDGKSVWYVVGIEIVRGDDAAYVEWAKRTGTILKLFGGPQ